MDAMEAAEDENDGVYSLDAPLGDWVREPATEEDVEQLMGAQGWGKTSSGSWKKEFQRSFNGAAPHWPNEEAHNAQNWYGGTHGRFMDWPANKRKARATGIEEADQY